MINEIVPILIKRKQQILITFLVIVTGVAAATFLMPKRYETHMKILVKSDRADNSASSGDVSEALINTEIELLNSNDLLEQVVKSTGLQHAERTRSVAVHERAAVAVEMAVRRLQKELKVSAVRKANIIDVTYSATDPRLAALVLRQFAEIYLDAHLRVHSEPGTYEFFAGQTERYKQKLEAIEGELADFRESDSVVLMAQQKEAMLQKSMESKSELLQAEAAIGEYQSKIDRTTNQLSGVAGRVVTQSKVMPNQYVTERLNTMLTELQNKRTQLLAKFRPEDRAVKEVEQEIADTQASLEKANKLTGVEQTTDVNPLRQSLEIDLAKERADLAGMEARRQALASQEESYREQLAKLDGATSEYDDLTRRRKEAEDNYLLYSRKTEEARIAESLDKQKISNVTVIETPSEPHLPSKPNVPLNLVLGTFLAGCVSVGTALCAEYFQRLRMPGQHFGVAISGAGSDLIGNSQHLLTTVTGPSDLEELTGLPVLALLDGR